MGLRFRAKRRGTALFVKRAVRTTPYLHQSVRAMSSEVSSAQCPEESKQKTLRPMEVAAILSISRSKVYQLLKDGKIPGGTVLFGCRRVIATDFFAYLNGVGRAKAYARPVYKGRTQGAKTPGRARISTNPRDRRGNQTYRFPR